MSNKIKIELEQGKKRHRLNGNSSYVFEADIKETNVMPISSEHARINKLFVYPDILNKGKTKITVVNLSPMFVDLYRGDHIADLKKIIGK